MTSSAADRSQIMYARFAGFMYLFVNAAYPLGPRAERLPELEASGGQA